MKTLETERLILRPFSIDDLEDFFEYCSLETVGPNAGWSVHKNREESKAIIEKFIEKDDVLALYHKHDKKVIGSVGLHYKETESAGSYYEIGYVLSTPYEGRGLMTEACKEVIKYAFLVLEIPEIYVCHFLNNDKSRRVIEKCNFDYLCLVEYETVNFGKKKSKAYKLTRDRYIKNIEERAYEEMGFK